MTQERSVAEIFKEQIAEARKTQKERLSTLEKMRITYGAGGYDKLIELIGEVDTLDKAELAQAVSWDLSLLIALSNSTESEKAEILGHPTDQVMTKIIRLHEEAKKNFPFIIPANRKKWG